MTNLKKKIICPICGKKETWTAENIFRPFCSERCKLIDLGEWAGEKRSVPGEPANPTDIDKEEDDL